MDLYRILYHTKHDSGALDVSVHPSTHPAGLSRSRARATRAPRGKKAIDSRALVILPRDFGSNFLGNF
jgi:hypothetical protein